jgi:hypothetical protein
MAVHILQIKHYRVIAKLGQGGLCTVFRAEVNNLAMQQTNGRALTANHQQLDSLQVHFSARDVFLACIYHFQDLRTRHQVAIKISTKALHTLSEKEEESLVEDHDWQQELYSNSWDYRCA